MTTPPIASAAERLALRPTKTTLNLCREDRVNGIAQMLDDLYQLATKDGCIAAGWALEFAIEVSMNSRIDNDPIDGCAGCGKTMVRGACPECMAEEPLTPQALERMGAYELQAKGPYGAGFMGWEDDRGWLLAMDTLTGKWSYRGEDLPETANIDTVGKLVSLLAALGCEVSSINGEA